MRRGFTALLAVLLCFGVAACDDKEPQEDDHTPIRDIRDQDDGPYGVVAVDNHFHDIHPEDEIEIESDRIFFVRNDGSNLHNFSIRDTDISKDLEPGDRLTWAPLSEHLEPGTYEVFCKYHDGLGMTGTFSVIE